MRSKTVLNGKGARRIARETSGRLLHLLTLLQARRDWPGGELAERLEVTTRTIRRDVERLRDLGYPVESLSGPAGGYRLTAGTAMPPLLLDDDEAIAIAVGLTTAAQGSVTGIEETSVRALVKLEQVLPARLRRRVRALLGATTTILPSGGDTVDPELLSTLAAACRDRERLRFDYRRGDGQESRREAEPHALVNRGRRWYLVAWDRARDDWRTFRLDRLRRPRATGTRFETRPIPHGDAGVYVAEGYAAAMRRYEAEVTLHAPAEEMHEPARRLWGSVEAIDEETCLFRSGDFDLDWLALRIAMLGVDFEVHEPAELAARMGVLAERLARGSRAHETHTTTKGS